VTLGFAYLLVFLGGFTLALVTGLARRLLHPSELCDHVVVPAHDHLRGLRVPIADLVSSFLTVFGLVCLIIHGVTPFEPSRTMVIGGIAGLIGVLGLRSWLSRVCDPTEGIVDELREVRVVREIPGQGYGQVEVELAGTPLKLAARSESDAPIPVGSLVEILDRTESVVVVRARG
jgi:hypothetical protein